MHFCVVKEMAGWFKVKRKNIAIKVKFRRVKMDLNNVLDKMVKNAIDIRSKTMRKKVPIGASKIGGKPDVPKDFEWFYYGATKNSL